MTAPAPGYIADLCRSVFADNVAMGWWNDLHTGESLVGKRNVGELLMLCVSELCEAADGLDDWKWDDKLPDRRMFEVELADFVIRVADLAGGLSLAEDLGEAYGAVDPGPMTGYRAQDSLLRTIRYVSDAMEHHRKGRTSAMVVPLAAALRTVFHTGAGLGFDVTTAIAEKRDYNRTRADHQVAARRAADGKRY